MISRALVPCLAAALWLVGCKMSDGPLPAEDRELPNRLEDIGRDLDNISAGHAEASQEFADDLRSFVNKPDAEPAVAELSRQIASAIPKKPFAADRGLQLARQLWLTVASRELSDKQIETLQSNMQAALSGVGVTDQHARAIAAQAGEVQKRVTNRSRRWYESF